MQVKNKVLNYRKIFEIGRLPKGYLGCSYSPKILIELTINYKKECLDWETLQSTETYVISIVGYIVCGKQVLTFGQIISELKNTELYKNEKIRKLLDIWEEFHVNDLKAGTKIQEEFLNRYYKSNPEVKRDYDMNVEILKENNLLIHNGYRYGTKWLCRPVTDEEVEKIISFFESNFKEYPLEKFNRLSF